MSVAARFSRAVTAPVKHHVYLSRSQDVATNLSIEHYLFQKSHPESTVLFLYVNRPCIVLGRNQNPWLEVNHSLAKHDKIKVIRRRSGGGTVFHDLGNVNFSVICPPPAFHRDKYAEMVVQAIRKFSLRARVNERHDIVLDPGELLLDMHDHPDPEDTHRTAYAFGDGTLVPRKVSGSAYKLSRLRALHHGTCLFNSPNIAGISEYLRSPARPFLKARGVESVRSPITNISSGHQSESPSSTIQSLQRQIIEAFIHKYNLDIQSLYPLSETTSAAVGLSEHDQCTSGVIDDTLLEIPDIAAGREELESPEYLYNQTPQFILSTHACEEDDRPRPPLPEWFPPSAHIYLKVKSGLITSTRISTSSSSSTQQQHFDSKLRGRKIAEITSFDDVLGGKTTFGVGRRWGSEEEGGEEEDEVRRVSAWLDLMLGKS
ncbi:MAG: hypothetical protein Q9173_004418 [Seirophora scorigena]